MKMDWGREFQAETTLEAKEWRWEVDLHLGAFRASEWTCLRLGEGWGVKKEGGMMEWSPTIREQRLSFCFSLRFWSEGHFKDAQQLPAASHAICG